MKPEIRENIITLAAIAVVLALYAVGAFGPLASMR